MTLLQQLLRILFDTDISGQIVNILQSSQRDVNLTNKEVSSFLGSDTVATLLHSLQTYKGLYYRNVMIVNLLGFLNSNGIQVTRQVGLGEREYYSPEFANIEISPRVYQSCFSNGFIFLQRDSFRGVLELSYSDYNEQFRLGFFYKRDVSVPDWAQNFIEKWFQFSIDRSFLKNAKIDPNLNHLTLDTKYTWDDIILPKNIKHELQVNVTSLLKNIEIYRRNNIVFKRGLILKGAPGTGKTLICKILATQVPCTFIWVTPQYLARAYDVWRLCSLARELSPTVLFLEDIDLYGESRSSNLNNSLLGELMNQLDGLVENKYVITIATTNQIDGMEGALKNRPGRFDRVIEVPLPDAKGRLAMLKHYCKEYGQDNLNFEAILKVTEQFTGAHIKELVSTAVILAVDSGSMDESGRVLLKQCHFSGDVVQQVRNKKIESTVGFSVQPRTSSDLEAFDGPFDLKGGL